nr:phenylalanyl-tRNA synthetase beta subunit [Boldiaceae sp.]
MKISWNWLKEIINIKFRNPYKISNQLTLAGCEIENITYKNILGLKDIILDINSTPNRSDLLSIIGIAKEIATLNELEYNMQQDEYIKNYTDQLNIVNNNLKLKDNKNYNIYYKSCISQIKVEISPLNIQRKLLSAGIQPKNNIIDIGNYIMIKWGQPLEIIDISKIQLIELEYNNLENLSRKLTSFKIPFITDNNKEYNINHKILATTYKEKAIYLTGIAPSIEVIINDNTTSIYIEASILNSNDVRKNSQLLGVRTESSIRHERGLNIKHLRSAYAEACALINKCCISSIQHNIFTNDLQYYPKNEIKLNYDKIKIFLGPSLISENKTYLSEDNTISILKKLGCSIFKDKNSYKVKPPFNRINDINREIDLAEEIARIHGFNNFLDKVPYFKSRLILSTTEQFLRQIRIRLKILGFIEVINYSLIINNDKKCVTLENPLVKEHNALRTSLIYSLIKTLNYNYKQGNGYVKFFEIGRVFKNNNRRIDENEYFSGVLGGNILRNSWKETGKKINWYQAKGKIETILSILNKKINWLQYNDDLNHEFNRNLFHPSKSTILNIDKHNIGIFGQLHPKILKPLDLNTEIFAFEINFSLLFQLSIINKTLSYQEKFKEYSNYPIIIRDIAVIAPKNILITDIINRIYINATHTNFLKKVDFFDEYESEKIEKGNRSIAFRLYYQANNKTLTATEVDELHKIIIQNLANSLKINIR